MILRVLAILFHLLIALAVGLAIALANSMFLPPPWTPAHGDWLWAVWAGSSIMAALVLWVAARRNRAFGAGAVLAGGTALGLIVAAGQLRAYHFAAQAKRQPDGVADVIAGTMARGVAGALTWGVLELFAAFLAVLAAIALVIALVISGRKPQST